MSSSKSSKNSSIYSNIFKNSKTNNLKYLNIHNDIYYEKYNDNDNNNNITKVFFSKSKFDREIYVLYMLNKMELDIVPDITNINYNEKELSINMNTNKLISLRQLLETNTNFHYIINELLSFLNIIKNKKILIGNLNIDTIYVNKDIMKFYILDISNTIFTYGLSEKNLDIQSLYISLYDNQQNEVKVIRYFEDQINDLSLSKYNYTNNIIDAYI